MKRSYVYILSTLLLIAGLTGQSCRSGKKTEKQENRQEQSSARILQVDDLLDQAENRKEQEVEIEGICTHICAHGGGKIFLMGSDDTRMIRVEAGEKVGSFGQETVNNIVRVRGILKEERIDEAYLLQWEEQLKTREKERHGEGEAGCSSEQQARGEKAVNTPEERIAAFRKRIAERREKEGKNYLSFYHIDAQSYSIQ